MGICLSKSLISNLWWYPFSVTAYKQGKIIQAIIREPVNFCLI